MKFSVEGTLMDISPLLIVDFSTSTPILLITMKFVVLVCLVFLIFHWFASGHRPYSSCVHNCAESRPSVSFIKYDSTVPHSTFIPFSAVSAIVHGTAQISCALYRLITYAMLTQTLLNTIGEKCLIQCKTFPHDFLH